MADILSIHVREWVSDLRRESRNDPPPRSSCPRSSTTRHVAAPANDESCSVCVRYGPRDDVLRFRGGQMQKDRAAHRRAPRLLRTTERGLVVPVADGEHRLTTRYLSGSQYSRTSSARAGTLSPTELTRGDAHRPRARSGHCADGDCAYRRCIRTDCPRRRSTALCARRGCDADAPSLESTFGKMAVHEAARQVRRRPRWRGRARHSPLCGPPYLIRRAQFIACTTAGKRGEAEIRPEHLSMACCASRVTRSALVWAAAAAARPPASACTPAHRIECGWCWPSTESTSIGSARTCSTAERPDPAERRRSHDTSH